MNKWTPRIQDAGPICQPRAISAPFGYVIVRNPVGHILSTPPFSNVSNKPIAPKSIRNVSARLMGHRMRAMPHQVQDTMTLSGHCFSDRRPGGM